MVPFHGNHHRRNGIFTDAYDLFCISSSLKCSAVFTTTPTLPKPGSLPRTSPPPSSGVALIGTLAGQLFFGWLGDKMGRKKVYGVTLMLMPFIRTRTENRYGYTLFLQVLARVRIGGDYPLSATIMSEYANKKTRGAFIAAVFAMQGFGILAGGIFGMILSSAFEAKFKAPAYEVDPIASTAPQADFVWRIILMAGALPAMMTFYSRSKMPETARYTALVAKDAKQAAADMSKVLNMDIEAEQPKVEQIEKKKGSYGLFSKEFLSRHGLHLLGTASTWFLLDIAFYSQNLFQKDIFSAIGWIPGKNNECNSRSFTIARAQTLIALCSTVPGYWFTVALIDVIGRFAIQLIGSFS
ncbi:hypothetical protein DH2020_024636 [Rehmannia glutinosa]|uniref:Major facilitator superfamily (MFS) profile domain-containing protein n=1 Tax=Rehmannia glutinosa TaxID=99300 RepID=A0ABR0W4H1_REHGL